MDRISLNELFNKRMLYVPEYEDSFTVWDLNRGCRFKKGGGIYVFHTDFRTLYIGISSDIRKRTIQHVRGEGGSQSLFKWLNTDERVKCSVFYEPDPCYREILENYLIKTNRPLYNIKKQWI